MLSDTVASLIQRAADALFVPWLVVLLFGTGFVLTLRYRGVQVGQFRRALRIFTVRQSAEGEGALTPFQAFMTALAATVGTGNIAGVAAGIVSGGPGALFWIWGYGFVATTIKASEAVLGLRFRRIERGTVLSGPMYYLRDGVGSRPLAAAYALIAGVAALTTTPFTQPNSMAIVLESQFAVPTWLSGLAIAVATWMVIIRGIRSIGRAAERLTPIMVALYLLGGTVVVVLFAYRIPEVLALVVREAFSFEAVSGGALGILVAMRYGLARGMYATEAGYGTAAVAYGTAQSRHPAEQGLNAVMEVYIVSFVTCTMSGLVVLLTGAWESGETSTAAVALAFDRAMPVVGGWIVAAAAVMFGYTTLIGWAYYGEQFFEYLLGVRVATPYRWAYALLIPAGAMARVDVVWAWGDLMNALQIFPNLIGILALSGIVAAVLREKRA